MLPPRLSAILQALLVTFLWSTSWVLIKFGLEDIPALTFAGLRYFIAFVILLLVFLRQGLRTELRALTSRDWRNLVILGLLYYTVTQGSQFVGLAYLPAITFSLLLNTTAVIVALLGIPLLREIPSWTQWLGMGVFLVGVFIFFVPNSLPTGSAWGYMIAGVHIFATSLSSVFGRGINRSGHLSPLIVTLISMGIGSATLLGVGLWVEPLPHLNWLQWGNIIWLAAVNTALAFTLWNHTLRTLSATESSMINNTMLIQITLLAWVFLGERIGWIEGVGLCFAAGGTLLVQWRFSGRK